MNRIVLLCLCSYHTWNWNMCGWVTSHLCWHKKNGFSCRCYQLCLFLCHLPLHAGTYLTGDKDDKHVINRCSSRLNCCWQQNLKCGCFIEFDYVLNFPALIWSNSLIDLRCYVVTLKIFWVVLSKQLCIWTTSGFSWSYHIPQSIRVYLWFIVMICS